MTNSFNRMYKAYGLPIEGRKDEDIAQLWKILADFPRDLLKAKKDNEEAALKALKAQQVSERKKAMKAKRANQKKGREKGVFERYAEERAGDVDDIVARFRKNKEDNRRRSANVGQR